MRAVKKVVKPLPVAILQQHSNASSYMRIHLVMGEHYTNCSAFHAYYIE
jgi:hypothetical protein